VSYPVSITSFLLRLRVTEDGHNFSPGEDDKWSCDLGTETFPNWYSRHLPQSPAVPTLRTLCARPYAMRNHEDLNGLQTETLRRHIIY